MSPAIITFEAARVWGPGLVAIAQREHHEPRGAVVSDVESGTEQETDHPEVDRAYDRERGGQVPEGQEENESYEGPDPEDDERGNRDDEDQGV
jgi:hypothetical protein